MRKWKEIIYSKAGIYRNKSDENSVEQLVLRQRKTNALIDFLEDGDRIYLPHIR